MASSNRDSTDSCGPIRPSSKLDMNGIIQTSAPIYEEDENVEVITVTEEMEAFFILDKYFPGGG